MATFRLLDAKSGPARTGADLYGCTYTPDGAFVLSAGWDGFLRLWEPSTGVESHSSRVGLKALSCCGISPDGRRWLAGSIEGVLTIHDAGSLALVSSLAAHTHPISAIRYGPDGELAATASWDRQVVLRKFGKDKKTRVLSGHKDIVAGCRFTGDGGRLLSWSYDGTLRLWDVADGREVGVLKGHADRVTAADLSPDGGWAVSGGRDGELHLWDLSSGSLTQTVRRPAEVRACFFLLDGASVVVVDATGAVTLLSAPGLEVSAEVKTRTKPVCADLAPSGTELVLGCEDGRVRFVAVEGLEEAALVVTAGRRTRAAAGVLGRLLGKARLTSTYEYTCPACRRAGEASALPAQPFPCAGCRRKLRISDQVRQLQAT